MQAGHGMLAHTGGWQLKRIHFVAARQPDAHSSDPGELGLIPLNDPVEPVASMGRPLGKAPAKNGKLRAAELFSEADVVLQWSTVRKTGAGLQNLGNTCFMNSVLQCLIHTPPLAELFLSRRALGNGNSNGFDPLAMTRDLMQRSLQHRGPIVSPVAHAKSLRRICRSFRLGRQEDAHEYLIALLDAIHESSIAGLNPKPAPELAQTSFVYRIFAGKMRSQVKCSSCGYESNTYDPFLDLSLEITRAHTVERALERFTTGEVLDGSNKYKCPKEQKGVRAVKRMTIHAAPNVLVIQLKRFEFSMSGHKISKKVDFGTSLDISPYMSKRPATPAVYDLYGVLVHSGHSVHSGHYYSFVRACNGMWHCCDDTQVSHVSERMVLAQKAYILFYIKRSAPGRPSPAAPLAAAATAGLAASPRAEPSPRVATAVAAAAANPFQQQQDLSLQRRQQQQAASSAAAPAAAAAAAVAPAAGGEPLQEKQQQQQQEEALAQPGKRRAEEETIAAAKPAKRPRAAAAAQGAAVSVPEPSAEEQPAPAAAAAARAEAPAAAVPPSPGAQQRQQRVPSRAPKLELPFSPAATRHRLRARGGALLTPFSSRREQRLQETSSLHRSLAMAQRRRGQAQQQQQQQEGEEQEQQGEVAASPPPMAASCRGAKKAARRLPQAAAPAATAAAGAEDSGPLASSPSTSTVTAPDWPPVKPAPQAQAPAQAGGQQPAPVVFKRKRRQQQDGDQQQQQQQNGVAETANAAAAPKAGQAAPAANDAGSRGPGGGQGSKQDSRQFLKQAAGGLTGLGVGTWDTVDDDTRRQHDRLLKQAAAKRKAPDEYDMEYDQGKVKKVRSKAPGSGSQLGSRVFDAAAAEKQRGGPSGGKANPVQLRGNKKKRQEQAAGRQR